MPSLALLYGQIVPADQADQLSKLVWLRLPAHVLQVQQFRDVWVTKDVMTSRHSQLFEYEELQDSIREGDVRNDTSVQTRQKDRRPHATERSFGTELFAPPPDHHTSTARAGEDRQPRAGVYCFAMVRAGGLR